MSPPRKTRCICTRSATASCERPTFRCCSSIRNVPKITGEAGGPFDTVLCVNVLEYVEDPDAVDPLGRQCFEARRFAGRACAAGSRLCMEAWIKTLGHRRRFSRAQLRALLEQHWFRGRSDMRQLNKIGSAGLVVLRQAAAPKAHQQSDAEDLRQNRVDLAAFRCSSAVARPVADRGGDQAAE